MTWLLSMHVDFIVDRTHCLTFKDAITTRIAILKELSILSSVMASHSS
jgi:hypothetical protein